MRNMCELGLILVFYEYVTIKIWQARDQDLSIYFFIS